VTPSDQATLGQAKRWLLDHVDQGERCPCCTQMAKVYYRAVTSTAARALIVLHHRGGWVHVPSEAGLARAGGEIARMAYWQLIEEGDATRTDGGHAGWWRITETGRAWVRQEITIPKYARIYDGRCLGLKGEPTSITDTLGRRFNLRELMAAWQDV
jgi:hypothetical protein